MITFDDGFLHPVYTDTVGKGEYKPRLSCADIRELQDQYNVNLHDDDSWFDGDTGVVSHMREITELEFFECYVD